MKTIQMTIVGLLCSVSFIVKGQLRNGGFEDIPINAQVAVGRGSQLIAPWIVEQGSVDLMVGKNSLIPFSPIEGMQFLIWNPGKQAVGNVLSQQLSVEPEKRYRVSFRVGRAGDLLDARLGVTVLGKNGSVLGGTLASAPQFVGWGDYQSFLFNADSSVAVLKFTDLSKDPDNNDILLDDVRVEAITDIRRNSPVVSASDIWLFLPGDGDTKEICGDERFNATESVMYMDGVSSKCFYFSGQNCRIVCTNAYGMDGRHDFTFQTWIYWEGLSYEPSRRCQAIFTIGEKVNLLIPEPVEINANPGLGDSIGRLIVHLPGVVYIKTGLEMPVKRWTLLNLIKQGPNYRIYLDGSLKWSGTGPDVSALLNPIEISSWDGLSFFGAMDEVAFYRSALTESQIQSVFYSGTASMLKGPRIMEARKRSSGLELFVGGIPGHPVAIHKSADFNQWNPNLLLDNNTGTETFKVPIGEKSAFYMAVPIPFERKTKPSAPSGMVWIPPGTFPMGSPATEKDRESNEGPQTQVTISQGFWMSKYETTQEQFLAVMGNNPSYFTGDTTRPVEQVNWHEATNYCSKLTAQEQAAGRLPDGFFYRLPTEAEWEYACRAGTTTRFSFGDDPNYSELGNYAWFGANSNNSTHPVGQKQPNPWGLYDMHGNVWEWCLDWYKDSYSGGSVVDPKGPSQTTQLVLRSGSWFHEGKFARSAYRGINTPEFRHIRIGFRVVLARYIP